MFPNGKRPQNQFSWSHSSNELLTSPVNSSNSRCLNHVSLYDPGPWRLHKVQSNVRGLMHNLNQPCRRSRNRAFSRHLRGRFRNPCNETMDQVRRHSSTHAAHRFNPCHLILLITSHNHHHRHSNPCHRQKPRRLLNPTCALHHTRH